ncbi:OLC1v1008795C1 [Oldenlandia corymbosa var. corymbosa]|nr:OLC1v1008795C1 [Oldenlandia corymbosa var. corymbosa]
MEAHKSRALIRFLNRSRKCMDYYIHVLEGAVVEDLMDAYDGLDPKWREDPKGFLRMMIRDGCFMLELLRASSALSSSFGNDIGGQGGGYADNDPIFSNHGKLHMMPYIKRDMLMLENQLPMLLLTTLLSEEEEMIDEKVDEKVNKLIVEFCSLDKQCYLELGKCKHVLDVYRKVLLGDDNHPKLAKLLASSWLPERPTTGDDILPSATHLYEAGISIQKSGTESIRDISFHAGIFNGVLRIPPLIVDDITEPLFLNLMAFERFHVGIGNDVTSYISFMVDLIDDERDVSHLHFREIILNACGSGRAAAKLINSLGKDISLDPDSPLFSERSKARNYCKRRWNRWRGNLVHTYFKSPWTAISLIAAILLFGLTFFDVLFNNIIFNKQQS